MVLFVLLIGLGVYLARARLYNCSNRAIYIHTLFNALSLLAVDTQVKLLVELHDRL